MGVQAFVEKKFRASLQAPMLKTYFRLLSQYPIAITTAFLPIVVVSVVIAQQVGVDNNIRIWFEPDDPAMQQYDSFLERFGRDVAISVVIYGDNLFTEEKMEKFRDGAQKLKEYSDWYEDAISIGDVYFIWKDAREKFPTHTRRDREDPPIERFRREVIQSDLFRGLLVSKDGRAAALNFTLTEDCNHYHRPAAFAMAKRVAEEIAGSGSFDLVGQPVHGNELDQLSLRVKKLYIAVIGVAFIMMIVLFRSVGLAFYGILAVISTLSILQTYIYLRGVDLNVVTAATATLVIVVSVANCVHLVTEFRQELAQGEEPLEALRLAAKHVYWPCLLNAITTSLGFLSLMSSGMIPVKNLGEFAAVGVVLAFVICLSVIIAGASLFRNQIARSVALRPPKPEETEFFYQVAHYEYEFRREIVYGAVVIAGIAIWSILHLRIETNPLEFFPETSAFSQAHRRVEKEFTGLSPFSIEVTGKSDMLGLENLRTLELLQDFIAHDPELKERIVRSTSAADMIKEVNRLVRGGGEFMAFIPSDPEILKKVLEGMPDRLRNVMEKNFLADENRTARVSVRAKTLSSSEYSSILDRLNEWIEKNLRGDYTAKITGVVPLVNNAQNSILTSQLQSFGIADSVIFIVYLLLLRNPLAAALVMFANLVPIFVTMGSMYWFDIPLNASTIMIASAAIGITVDDSIHFLHRYSHELKRLHTRRRALRSTLRSIGRAIAVNCVVNGIGFSVLFFSAFMPTIYFGGLLGLAMVTAAIGLLVILPAYILVFKVAGKETPTPLDTEEPDL
jgi:predicted RND superfamily exporter protein